MGKKYLRVIIRMERGTDFLVGWYGNGVKQGEVTWVNGKENGLWVIWHQNGEKDERSSLEKW